MWNKLHEQVAEVQSILLKVQPKFRKNLLENVEAYQREVTTFTEDYTTVSLEIHAVHFSLACII